MIRVQRIDANTFRVTVESRTTTTHTVTVSSSYYEKLTGKRVAPEMLVEKSFELPVISRYFPEYETTIGEMLAATG